MEELGAVPSNTFDNPLPSPLILVASTLPNEPVEVNEPLKLLPVILPDTSFPSIIEKSPAGINCPVTFTAISLHRIY